MGGHVSWDIDSAYSSDSDSSDENDRVVMGRHRSSLLLIIARFSDLPRFWRRGRRGPSRWGVDLLRSPARRLPWGPSPLTPLGSRQEPMARGQGIYTRSPRRCLVHIHSSSPLHYDPHPLVVLVSQFHRDMTPGVGARHGPPARAVDHLTSGVDIGGFGSCGFLFSSFSLPTV